MKIPAFFCSQISSKDNSGVTYAWIRIFPKIRRWVVAFGCFTVKYVGCNTERRHYRVNWSLLHFYCSWRVFTYWSSKTASMVCDKTRLFIVYKAKIIQRLFCNNASLKRVAFYIPPFVVGGELTLIWKKFVCFSIFNQKSACIFTCTARWLEASISPSLFCFLLYVACTLETLFIL